MLGNCNWQSGILRTRSPDMGSRNQEWNFHDWSLITHFTHEWNEWRMSEMSGRNEWRMSEMIDEWNEWWVKTEIPSLITQFTHFTQFNHSPLIITHEWNEWWVITHFTHHSLYHSLKSREGQIYSSKGNKPFACKMCPRSFSDEIFLDTSHTWKCHHLNVWNVLPIPNRIFSLADFVRKLSSTFSYIELKWYINNCRICGMILSSHQAGQDLRDSDLRWMGCV